MSLQQSSATSVGYRPALLVSFFAATMLLSAGLLFSVQPLVSKMLLPLLGGTPAVWNTCTVFFQALLLAGYGYAHVTTSRLRAHTQIVVHTLLLIAAAAALPLAISDEGLLASSTAADPTLWLLGTLAVSVGLPFFMVATTAPFLQRWFAQTNHPWAGDPYFLYAASNLGSLAALLGYPLWLESKFRLAEQSSIWAIGYGIFAIAVFICLTAALLNSNRGVVAGTSEHKENIECSSPLANSCTITWAQRLQWIFFAFVPSSLLLGVTTYLTTDIASIALLWVVPLALYLLTYIIAFGTKGGRLEIWTSRILPAGAVALMFLLLSEATQPGWLLVVVHLVFFFVAALASHLRLARDRPPAVHLTAFYFWISAGGVLGGAFNALVAPHLFDRILEYPLLIVLACLARPSISKLKALSTSPSETSEDLRASHAGRSLLRPGQLGDWLLPAGLGAFTVWCIWTLADADWLGQQMRIGLMFGVPLVISYLFADRALRFALGLAAVFLASGIYSGTHGQTLHAERNFYGVLRVTVDPNGESRRLIHGNTVHGRQYIDPARAAEPLSYYHRTGPLGDIFNALHNRKHATRVAVVGLGTGSILSYARPGDQWTYYEINPAVYELARNTNYFTYLAQCAAQPINVVLGDARLRMREAPDRAYDLIVLDAFSSDAIPVHLITREAIDLYLSKIAEGGLLAFHISNRWLDLEPVLGDLAQSAGLICHAFDEMTVSEREERLGKDQSHWLIMGRHRTDLGRLVKDSRWLPVNPRSEPQIWSDDFSNLLDALKWN